MEDCDDKDAGSFSRCFYIYDMRYFILCLSRQVEVLINQNVIKEVREGLKY